MQQKKRPLPAGQVSAVVIGVSAMLAALAAQAQGAEQGAVDEAALQSLPAVNVTAKGYAAESAQTPVSTTEVDRVDLDRTAAANLGDALRGQAGLAVASDSAQGQNPVIRGLQKESVVLMVDGVRLNSAQPAGAIGSFLSLGLAERVEVVKGPASVLYGTGALGGAINVQLPQARFEPGASLRTRVDYDSASKGWRGAGVGHFSQGDHALMLGASLARPDDYKAPQGRVARTGYDSKAFIGQYRFRLDAQQQLRLSAQRQQDSDVWYPGTSRPHPMPRVGQLTIHSPEQTRSLYEVGYSRRSGGERPLNMDVRLYRQEMARSIDAWASGLGRDMSQTRVTFATNGLDAKADWLAHPQHLLSIGLNAWQMKADPDSRSAMPPTFALQSNKPFHEGQLRAIGLYAQDDMQFGALKVLAGLRYDSVRGSAAAMNNGRITSGINRSDSAVSGSLGALYEITPLLRPYASVSRGFRAPDLRERYQSGPRQDGFYWAGSPHIAPEKALQFELGMKGDAEDVSYAVALWRNRISDYITGVQLSGPAAVRACGQPQAMACKQTVNLGHATLHGLDASVRWRLGGGHWLQAAYSHVRGTNNDLNEPLFNVPADSLSLGWEGRISPSLSLDATALLVKRQNHVATVFARGTENPTAGYGLLDVGASWRPHKQHTLRLGIKNVGDKRYHEHLAAGLPGRETPAPGRSLTLSWQGVF